MNTNIGYAFYQDYYAHLSFQWKGGKHVAVFDGTEKNEQLFTQKWSASDGEAAKRYTDQLQNESIELQTVYPGLLIGSGYQHEILSGEKDDSGDAYVQNELKLGFHFDYTTGLPVIPGSSVKGAIRSAFEFETGYIVELLDEICKGDATWTAPNTEQKRSIVETLEQTLFEHDGERCVYERDIFLDAFPVATGHRNGLFLGNDYITPHDSPLKSPNPVQFLKVLPQVTYDFAFRLSDSNIKLDTGSFTLSQSAKTELFLRILLDFGVGAKTNVGYGQFELDPETERRVLAAKREKEERAKEKSEAAKVAANIERANDIIEKQAQKQKEREEANLKRKEVENEEMKKNGLGNLLAAENNFNKGKNLIERYGKLGDINAQSETIARFVRNVLSGLQSQNDKKKWNRKGKDNWNHVQKWIGSEKATQLFNEYKAKP